MKTFKTVKELDVKTGDTFRSQHSEFQFHPFYGKLGKCIGLCKNGPPSNLGSDYQ